MIPMDVDSGAYVDACTELYDANHGVVDLMVTLVGALGSSGGMAGTDTGGEQWANSYDQASGPAVQAGADLGSALGNMGNLMNGSLKNHLAADYGAQVAPYGETDTGDSNPDHYSESLSPATPPSAKGGTGDQPGWWHWIAGHVGGLLWPDADTGRLRSTGDAWKTAGTDLAAWAYSLDAAASSLSGQKSPEISDAIAACHEVRGHVTELASAYGQIGDACRTYADQVDAHHQEVEDELTSFIEWTAGIEVAGGLLAVVTVGISEAAAQAAEAAEVANAAQKVIRILNDLIELARLGMSKIGELFTKITSLAGKLAKIINAKLVVALEKVGVDLAKFSPEAFRGLPGFTKDGLIDPAAFKTDPGKAFFWSGRTGGVGGEEVAGEIAGARDGTTLEQLMAKRGIKLPEWDADNPEVVKVWQEASAAYAQGASGEVRAVIGDTLRPGNVWQTSELPALEANPDVTRIVQIDPVTHVQTVVWPK